MAFALYGCAGMCNKYNTIQYIKDLYVNIPLKETINITKITPHRQKDQ
jgi:hypothetical protein